MRSLAAAVERLAAGGAVTLSRAPEGYDAFVVAALARGLARAGETRGAALVFVARDGARAQSFVDALGFAAPEVEALLFPSWDCQPYDRVSPNPAISSQRMTVLARLARSRGALERPRVLVVTVNALTQRAPPLKFVADAAFSAAPGNNVRLEELARWLADSGYMRVSSVHDVGDFAARGGILDLYPPGAAAPIRLDFFGDTLESIRAFDPETQLSVGPVARARSRAGQRSAADDRVDPPLPPGLCRRIRRAAPRRRALRGGERGAARDRPRALAAAVLRAHGRAVRLCRRRAVRARRARRGRGAGALRPDRRLLRRAPRRVSGRSRQFRLSAAAARPALSDRGRIRRAARRRAAGAAHAVRGAARRARCLRSAAAGSAATSRPSGSTRTPASSTPPCATSARLAIAA